MARAIDTILYTLPMVGVMVWLYLTFDLERTIQQVSQNPVGMLKTIGIMVLGMLTYGVVTIVIFGALEGIYGWSPGKLICGLRVIRTTLEPIGVLRGLIRQFLLIIDGQFNYLVGGAMVAVLAKRQRLGDLAADSIVVDAASLTEPETR